ncbi:MAG: hypothetical protein ACKOAF_05445 [Actinomycetes bacterium]
MTIVHPRMDNDRGNLTPNYSNPVSTTIVEGCSVQPGSAPDGSSIADRHGAEIRLNVYLPIGTMVTQKDAILVDGVRYRISGTPETWPGISKLGHVRVGLVDWAS